MGEIKCWFGVIFVGSGVGYYWEIGIKVKTILSNVHLSKKKKISPDLLSELMCQQYFTCCCIVYTSYTILTAHNMKRVKNEEKNTEVSTR
jgi:hypothetical protein